MIGIAPSHDYSTVTALARIVDPHTLNGLRRIQPFYPADTDPGKQIAQVIQQMSQQLD